MKAEDSQFLQSVYQSHQLTKRSGLLNRLVNSLGYGKTMCLQFIINVKVCTRMFVLIRSRVFIKPVADEVEFVRNERKLWRKERKEGSGWKEEKVEGKKKKRI